MGNGNVNDYAPKGQKDEISSIGLSTNPATLSAITVIHHTNQVDLQIALSHKVHYQLQVSDDHKSLTLMLANTSLSSDLPVIPPDDILKSVSTAVVDGKIITIGGSIHTENGAQINGSVIETNLKEGLVYREYEQEEIVKGESDFSLDKRSERARSDWIFPDPNMIYLNRNEGFVLNPINETWDSY